MVHTLAALALLAALPDGAIVTIDVDGADARTLGGHALWVQGGQKYAVLALNEMRALRPRVSLHGLKDLPWRTLEREGLVCTVWGKPDAEPQYGLRLDWFGRLRHFLGRR